MINNLFKNKLKKIIIYKILKNKNKKNNKIKIFFYKYFIKIFYSY